MRWCPSRATILAVASFLVVALPVAAQTPVDSAARAVSRQLEAMRSGDYLTAARLTTPAELRHTRVAFDSLLRADSSNYLAQRLFRLDSTKAVERLPDDAFTASLMAFTFGLRSLPAYFATTTGVDVAGGVPVGADTVIVVYRWHVNADSHTPAEYNTATAVRCARGWCPASAGNYASLISLLREPMVRVPVKVNVSPR